MGVFEGVAMCEERGPVVGMSRTARGRAKSLFALLLGTAILCAPLSAVDSRRTGATEDELWRQSISLVGKGNFSEAAQAIRQVKLGAPVTDQVRAWLEEYGLKQKARKELDLADFEKYVGYARQRIERKEYPRALSWVLSAYDVAQDREVLLALDWVQDLVNDALAEADRKRREDKWRDVWHIYSRLAALYEREPRYEKLEREAATQVRVEGMFKKKRRWDERMQGVLWNDAKKALEYIGLYYVEIPDFKQSAESALEQLLVLADSKTAQERFEGLGNEVDRNDFKARLRARLERVRAAPSLTRREAVEHLRRVVKDINEQTVRLPEEVIVSELTRGALEPLDDFTTVIWPKETEEFEKHTRGDFIGVGISIIKNPLGEIEVVTPLDDTPAFRAGVQAGDIIANVDGVSLEGYSLNKVVETITGPENTEVTLTIRRDGDLIEFDLVRARVKIQSVKGWTRNPDERWNHWLDRENGIGYIRITNFQKNTAEDLTNVMSELQAGDLNGLILDLRWNPGGLLDSAFHVSSLFLKDGETVVSTKGRRSEEDQMLTAAGTGPYADIPLVVLVDDSSASASEIVSGAVRDNRRGLVIGERTFGKFSVQNLIPLGPSRAKLKITTARYYLPSGVSLHREPGSLTWGVEPDIAVRLVRKERIKAYQMRREADLLGPPAPKKKKPEQGDEEAQETSPEPGLDEVAEDTEKTEKDAVADESKGEELPPLDQPDENNRPTGDPQVDTALLVLRIRTLAQQYPTIAAAERGTGGKTANP